MKKSEKTELISDFRGCQLPCVPKFATASVDYPYRFTFLSFKRFVAVPWNHYVKIWLKKIYYFSVRFSGGSAQQSIAKAFRPDNSFKKGDAVRVRSKEDIISTLDPFGELKGCSFLPEMHQYCGTEQLVFRAMQYFMDERDYKLKKTQGLILLENIFCAGTPVFGQCDRSCFLFWRHEWLQKI
jgi:hypothetical protein